MPLYEYFCTKCEIKYEIKVPLTRAGEKIACPKCGTLLNKLLAAPMFRI